MASYILDAAQRKALDSAVFDAVTVGYKHFDAIHEISAASVINLREPWSIAFGRSRHYRLALKASLQRLRKAKLLRCTRNHWFPMNGE